MTVETKSTPAMNGKAVEGRCLEHSASDLAQDGRKAWPLPAPGPEFRFRQPRGKVACQATDFSGMPRHRLTKWRDLDSDRRVACALMICYIVSTAMMMAERRHG